MLNEIKTFLIALQFFTRLPVTGALGQWADFSLTRLNASARYFPLVGALVGASSVGAMTIAWVALGGSDPLRLLIVSLTGLAAGLWVTGAFHEDGLADTADALGGHVSRERALEIMKDSRLGTYGVVALVLALLLKLLLVATLLATNLVFGLATVVAAHALSRVPPLWLMRGLTHVGDSATSKSKPLAQHISGGSLAFGTACGLGVAMICWGASVGSSVTLSGGDLASTAGALSALAFGSVVVVGAVGLVFARWLRTRLGGFTGDTLGAAQQVCELALYLMVVAFMSA
jgi:adenosylcobinamide-GDP ribazoletransferase